MANVSEELLREPHAKIGNHSQIPVFLTQEMYQYSITNTFKGYSCTQLAVELPFTTLPLLISLLHPILSLILIAPIRYTAQRFFPIFAKLLPTQEPMTPPLPRPFPSVRILVTEH
uniref:Ovule protein n=1 Tax=Meloidogyne hapla TaxID=6305 RepID=A0A1I8BUS7_MELHA